MITLQVFNHLPLSASVDGARQNLKPEHYLAHFLLTALILTTPIYFVRQDG